jgi:hypothetical protein
MTVGQTNKRDGKAMRQKGRNEMCTRYKGKEERNCFSILFDAIMCWW